MRLARQTERVLRYQQFYKSGRLIKEDRISTVVGENFHRINIAGLVTDGLYFITVEIPNQPILVQKIIRQE
jgi:hypothetical protein